MEDEINERANFILNDDWEEISKNSNNSFIAKSIEKLGINSFWSLFILIDMVLRVGFFLINLFPNINLNVGLLDFIFNIPWIIDDIFTRIQAPVIFQLTLIYLFAFGGVFIAYQSIKKRFKVTIKQIIKDRSDPWSIKLILITIFLLLYLTLMGVATLDPYNQFTGGMILLEAIFFLAGFIYAQFN